MPTESASVKIERIAKPELFFGFVAAAGADVETPMGEFKKYFESQNYKVFNIKITDLFPFIEKHAKNKHPLVNDNQYLRIQSYINFGNYLRKEFSDNSAVSVLGIMKIIHERLSHGNDDFAGNVYLIRQFKRKEEVELFRSIYGRLFFQVSIYSRRGTRVDNLARKFASDENKSNPNNFRNKAEDIVTIDEHEVDDDYGQRVSKVFHDADFIVNNDLKKPDVSQQVFRFCDLIMGSNSISPTKSEYGMFVAKAAALRTLDLSRQVGAAIFSDQGEVITLGSNEVPKAGGGTYWSDDEIDDREYIRGKDSNDARKYDLLKELVSIISSEPIASIGSEKTKRLKDSQFMDALEYGRIVHAEMSAICDAARLGRALKGAILFCTTFPCHMCAKHIVGSGISKVVFLEPYPKSLVTDLHTDSIQVEGGDRGRYREFPAVHFEHFYGVSYRRYRELFERSIRKDKDTSEFVQWQDNAQRPIMDIKQPFYAIFERHVAKFYKDLYIDKFGSEPKID